MTKVIGYKGIVHNVFNDAPFIGAIVIASHCSRACPGCINEHLKEIINLYHHTAKEIVMQVKQNGLNQGIILSGLEWSEQPEDLINLVKEGLAHGLRVMVYTYHTKERFLSLFPEIIALDIYVKFGHYEAALSSKNHYSYEVQLASTNQFIEKFGA